MEIPFGKYKGKDIEEVLSSDPNYVDWLQAQEWFAEKYRPIYNIVTNSIRSDAPTPEHNKLQARFLDDRTCLELAIRTVERANGMPDRIPYPIESYEKDRLIKFISGEKRIHKREFECISDVRFVVSAGIPSNRAHPSETFFIFYLELKPTLGDDYPSVLRQMNAQRDRTRAPVSPHAPAYRQKLVYPSPLYNYHVLVYGSFASVAITEQQLKQVFGNSGLLAFNIEELAE